MESINVIGLMTGTSCDGMDLSLVNCKKNNNSIDGKTIKNHYVKYPVSLTKKLLKSYISSPPELAKTHMQLGQFWSEKISEWVKENNLQYDLIGIHGQTVFHDGGQSTLQIGEPLYISKSLKVPVIYNFRTKDIINKGQGAPLMPVVDRWLFKNESKDIITLNIGGISNITIIDKNKNVASVTTTNGVGAGKLVGNTGIMPNNMLGEEHLNPYGFHAWPKKQRIPSNIAPTLVFKNKNPFVALGSAGSSRIVSAIICTLANIINNGSSVEEAVSSPRLHIENGVLHHEPFKEKGPVYSFKSKKVVSWKEKNMYFGGVNAASVGSSFGDDRRSGYSL